MFIVSPKWVYLSNKKIESNKSLLIEGSIIVDVLVDNKIDKNYRKIPRIHYQNHLILNFEPFLTGLPPIILFHLYFEVDSLLHLTAMCVLPLRHSSLFLWCYPTMAYYTTISRSRAVSYLQLFECSIRSANPSRRCNSG